MTSPQKFGSFTRSLLLVLTLGACGTPSSHQVGGAKMAPPTSARDLGVQVVGSVSKMQAGQVEGRVKLDRLELGSNSFGLGGLSELRGEITILGGVVWLAYPSGKDAVRVTRVAHSNESATLLIHADVPSWRVVTLNDELATSALGARVRQLALAEGVATLDRFPFLLEGHFTNVIWHAGRKPPATGVLGASGMAPDVHGTVLGFFSREEGGLIVPRGADVHLHAVLENETLCGHIDSATILPGTTVRLPVSTEAAKISVVGRQELAVDSAN